MQTSLLPQGTVLPQAGDLPALDLANVPNDELRKLCGAMYDDLHFLSKIVPERFGPLTSSGVTGLAAFAAGMIDGYLDDKANVGPVDINTVLLAVSAGGALLGPTANWREGSAAVARGLASPLLYGWAKKKGTAWRQSKAAQPQGTQIAAQ
jgi:hypothetical protein